MEYKIFGCKVNKYYTDKWLNSPYLRGKDGIFVASCVVTDNAKRKWLKFVKDNLKNIEKNEKIFISGCGAFERGKEHKTFFEIYPELEYGKNQIEILGEDPDQEIKKLEKEEKNFPTHNPPARTSPPPLKKGEIEAGVESSKNQKINSDKLKTLAQKLKKTQIYTKKFVLIQGGCDSFCTFCLTVQKRGRHFFRNREDILQEILDFEAEGGKEVVLTGVNLSAWGLKTTNDTKHSRFAELLEYLLKNSTIPRLRISSLGPEFIDDAVLKVFENTRIYPHFHFSIQSGSTDVLKNMARHYDGAYMRDLLQKTRAVKREDGIAISIGADIIVGFPGETEENFQETLEMVQNHAITKLHAFPFSAHEMGESVPAGVFKNQLSHQVKKDRMKRLTEVGNQVRKDFIESQRGKMLEVLVESVEYPHPSRTSSTFPLQEEKVRFKGWTQNYIEANEENFEVMKGEVRRGEVVRGRLR